MYAFNLQKLVINVSTVYSLPSKNIHTIFHIVCYIYIKKLRTIGPVIGIFVFTEDFFQKPSKICYDNNLP